MSLSNFVTSGKTPIGRIMASSHFLAGMADFHAKVWRQELADQTARYERGRQFAACTGLKKLRTSSRGRVFQKHIEQYLRHRNAGDIA